MRVLIYLLASLHLFILISFYSEASITVREDSKKLSNSQIKKALNEAHLENHGYKKIVTQETSKDSRGRLSFSKITSFTHKPVPCSNASQIVQDTESLLLNNNKDTMTGNFAYQNCAQTPFQIMYWLN